MLYLAAYDISHPKRLRIALNILKSYSTGGQKSVFECFLSHAEHAALLAEISPVIEPEDRFLLLRLDPRSGILAFGIAVPPQDPHFFYLG